MQVFTNALLRRAHAHRFFLLFALAHSCALAQSTTSVLRNLSSRSSVTVNGGPMITGFVVAGVAPKEILLRASGPGLSFFGVSNPLSEPTLTLFDAGGRRVATNSRWGSNANPAEIQLRASLLGGFPFSSGSADSALLLTLPPGAYTAHVSGNTSGVALLELYADRQETPGSRVTNLSTLLQVGTGEAVGIAGLWRVTNRRLLIRAIGPSLGAFGVANALADPVLEVIQPEWAGGTRLSPALFPAIVVARNDNWNIPIEALNSRLLQSSASPDDIRAATTASGAFPLPEGSKDAAMVVSFNTGDTLTINLQVRGSNGESGVTLIEVYEIP